MDLNNSLKAKLTVIAGLFLLFPLLVSAQDDDGGSHIFKPNIRSVQLYAKGAQVIVPVIPLNGTDQLTLHFDDLDGDVKSYSYVYELRNADWSPASMNAMEYTNGLGGPTINNYKLSSLAMTKYTHYTTTLPDPTYKPTKGGNYLLKVYQNGDPSDVVFQVRMLVVNNTMPVSAQINPPYGTDVHTTHQRIDFSVSLGNHQFNNPVQETKVTLLQNWSWASAHYEVRATNVQNGAMQYNTENDAVFPGTREWRWLDMRSFRFQSDRLAKMDVGSDRIDVAVRTDPSRAAYPYTVYQDQNGSFSITTTEQITVATQGDYAHVGFSYSPPDGQPYEGKTLYLYGALTNYEFNDSTKMIWDPERKLYHNRQFLKEGYYDYCYVLRDSDGNIDFSQTEGNFYDTENEYLILVYYRPLGGRFDELVGMTRVNSLAIRNAQQQ